MAKAIGIVAIVWGHTIYGAPRAVMWVYEFHVPLFVALSGVTLPGKRRVPSLRRPSCSDDPSAVLLLGLAVDHRRHGARGADRGLGQRSRVRHLGQSRCARVGEPRRQPDGLEHPLWFLPALFLLAVASYPLVVLDRRVGRGRVVLWMAAVLAGLVPRHGPPWGTSMGSRSRPTPRWPSPRGISLAQRQVRPCARPAHRHGAEVHGGPAPPPCSAPACGATSAPRRRLTTPSHRPGNRGCTTPARRPGSSAGASSRCCGHPAGASSSGGGRSQSSSPTAPSWASFRSRSP